MNMEIIELEQSWRSGLSLDAKLSTKLDYAPFLLDNGSLSTNKSPFVDRREAHVNILQNKEHYSGILLVILLNQIYKIPIKSAIPITLSIWNNPLSQTKYLKAILLTKAFISNSNIKWSLTATELISKFLLNTELKSVN